MGKKKDKKFGAPKHQPTGLLPLDGGDADSMNHDGAPAVVTEALEQLQSAEESTRECGCGTLAALAAQPGALPVLLSNNVVRILAPLVVDTSPSVRHRALGALRNMTVDGGLDVCHEMVLKDVLTPLIALFKQYGADWKPEAGPTKHTDTRLDTFFQAVHVLWNLCEASDVAVLVFNKEKLLPVLLPCLQHSIYGYPLATVVAQCLHTVTESNQEAVQVCRGEGILSSLKVLTEQKDSSSQAMLFQAALMGILMNVLGGELMNGPSGSAFVLALGQILDVDAVNLIVDYAKKKPVENESSLEALQLSPSGDHEITLGEEEGGFMSEREYQDIVNTLDAQCICLELTTNVCCSPDEEWEEVDSSESGSSDETAGAVDMEQDTMSDNNNFDPVCAPSEVHAVFLSNNIIAKVVRLSSPLPAELCEEMKMKKWWKKITKKSMRVRTHALLCINNLVEAMSAEAMGGMEALHLLWDSLAQQVIKPAAPEGCKGAGPSPSPSLLPPPTMDPDLLEATTSAMRAVIQRLAQLASPKFREVCAQDVQFLMRLAEGAGSGVQIHVLRIVAAMALMLVKVTPLHAVVQEVGGCLMAAAAHATDLVVVAEALDALFDVFSDDATDPLAQTLQLTQRLKDIQPQLKAKLQTQRKMLGENYVTVSTSRTNLIRFIKYKESKGKS